MIRKKADFEGIYSTPGAAPWTYSKIPVELKDLVSRKEILPGMSVLEIGCGEGCQAIYLAKKGMKVTAIDASKNAISFAKNNAKKSKVTVLFKQMHYSDMGNIQQKFDFIFDWRFLHEITSELQRDRYLQTISGLLDENGKYLSVSFSGDSEFMGRGTIRVSPVGIKIYFSKLKNLEKRMKKHFRVISAKHIIVPQKPNLRVKANYVFCRPKIVSDIATSELPKLDAAIRSARQINLPQKTGGDYAFRVYCFGERGTRLEYPLVNEIVDGLSASIQKNFKSFDYIVTPEPGGHLWGILLGYKLQKPVHILRRISSFATAEKEINRVTGYHTSSLFISDIKKGDIVLVLDDVVSTGGTLTTILGALERANARVIGVQVILAKSNKYKKIQKKFKTKIAYLKMDASFG
jgi:adenine phosphoribosyltransferase